VTLTFDLLTLKSIGVFYSKRAITLWCLKALGQRVLELLSGNGFHSSGHCDLDLWPTDPKINRGHLINKGYHPLRFEGSGSKGTRVIERKRSVTDGQTDRQPDRQGKNNMSPPEGGRYNYYMLGKSVCVCGGGGDNSNMATLWWLPFHNCVMILFLEVYYKNDWYLCL